MSAWFILVAGVAGMSRWSIQTEDRCRLDGVRIVATYRVDLVVNDASVARFCCVTCAAEWPEFPDDASWHVRDEMTGEVLDSSRAWFVKSRVVTVRSRGDRIHVFKDLVHALEHLEQYQGTIVEHPMPHRALAHSNGSTRPRESSPDGREGGAP
jgi:hypothetical protein